MKIGIVGAGQVGATAAYSMMMRRVGSGIMLVDHNADLAVAQARDILDATPFADPVRVRAGEFADLDGARLVVLAAGTNQRPGESRLDLLSRNAEIFSEIVPAVLVAAPDPIFLVATNPVDVMTQIVTAIAGRRGDASERVIGSGTILNSARFRTLLAAHLGISPTYIDARVLGEHGDSEVLHWSGAAAGNLPVAEVARQMGRCLSDADRSRIDTGVRRAADAIIKGKGATWFGVGAGLARIAQAIEDDERALLTCSMLTPECEGVRDVALSLPRVLGAAGVVKTLAPDLDAGERAALKRSAEILGARRRREPSASSAMSASVSRQLLVRDFSRQEVGDDVEPGAPLVVGAHHMPGRPGGVGRLWNMCVSARANSRTSGYRTSSPSATVSRPCADRRSCAFEPASPAPPRSPPANI